MATKTARRPFECYNCGREGKKLKVDGGTQRRRVARSQGRVTRVVAHVECGNCGNEWWSSHPDAIARAKSHDENRDRRHGRAKGSDE